MAVALLKFTQDANVGGDGEALVGDLADPFEIANSNNTGIGSWEIQILEVPYGSAVTKGVLAQANSSTPAGSVNPDAAGGWWRIQLRVWPQANRQGTPDIDIRCFGVPGANGLIAPPPQVWPLPLPHPSSGRPGAKPNELNVGGQDGGWAGQGDDGLLRHAIRNIGSSAPGDVTGPSSAVASRIAVFSDTTGKEIEDGGYTIQQLLESKIPLLVVDTTTLTLARETHAGKCLRFTHASGCLVTVNDDVFEEGDWVLMRATQAAAVSFNGSATIVPPASKVATSAEAGASMFLYFDTPDTADIDGRLSDA